MNRVWIQLLILTTIVCADYYQTNSDTGHTYYFGYVGTWDECKAKAQSSMYSVNKGYLATITSETENIWVKSFLNSMVQNLYLTLTNDFKGDVFIDGVATDSFTGTSINVSL